MVPLKQKSSKQEVALPPSCLVKVSYNFSIVSPSWEMFVMEKSHEKKGQARAHQEISVLVPIQDLWQDIVGFIFRVFLPFSPLSSPLFTLFFESIIQCWAIITHSACCHVPTAPSPENSRSWAHLAHFGATAKTLHFPASYTAHYQAANSVHEILLSRQQITSQFILIATSL